MSLPIPSTEAVRALIHEFNHRPGGREGIPLRCASSFLRWLSDRDAAAPVVPLKSSWPEERLERNRVHREEGRQFRYETKQARLCAIADAYRKKFDKSGFTTDEVCGWALKHGLWPVPTRGASASEATGWERDLAAAVAAEEPKP